MAIKRRDAAVVFVFITVVLDMLALGMIIPVLPKLIEGYAGSTQRAAQIFGIFGTAWALMQFLCSPVIGALSDRFGRRPIILMSNLGLGLDYILMAVAPNLSWLFIGRLVSGITASSISTSFAYIADVTTGENRSKAFGLIGAAFGVGFVLGPAVGGLLVDYGPRIPFWVAAGLSLTNFCYGALVLPESLSAERRAVFTWARANPIASLILLSRRRSLFGFATINFLDQLAHVVFPSTFVLYASFRYGWDPKTIGLTLTGVGVCSMIVQGGLVGKVIKLVGERSTLLIGLTFGMAGFVLYGLADTPKLFWMAIPIGSLWGLAAPPLQGMMSQMVDATEQGKLQGANTSLSSIAQLIGPGIFTLSFSYSIGNGAQWVGLPFLLAAMMVCMSLMVGFWAVRQMQAAPAAAE
jgi:DHA1 family tetracycline resistance protein-like MFS transporter